MTIHTADGRSSPNDLSELIGSVPHRMALAGGWIDQPFVSSENPEPPGSMVVVSLEPCMWLMDRCGMASGTRKVALQIWGRELPNRPYEDLVRELYCAENHDRPEPSGSQDMIGLIYPGISRLDYDIANGGIFPTHIESNCDPVIARWLEDVVHLIPVNQRPESYNPLGVKNLDRAWIAELGRTGKDCFSSICARDIEGLGRSMNRCMECWRAILPHTVAHPSIPLDLRAILAHFQSKYPGAMYSGCGGGYLLVVSHEEVPGSMRVKVRLA